MGDGAYFVRRMHALNDFLERRSRAWIGVATVLSVAFMATLDYATGYELSFSIFYLGPVGLAAWYAGLSRSASLLAASAWFAVDARAGHEYGHWLIRYWNTAVRLGFFVIVASLLVRVRKTLDEQTRLAERDGLTGLLNFRAFAQRYDMLARMAIRQQTPLSIAYIDLDDFKAVNNSLGHNVGDDVLRSVGNEMRRRLRDSDVVARLGGDEFGILLPATGTMGAQTLFADVHGALSRLTSERGWPVGFSVGVVVFISPPPSVEQALRAADAQMYQVKDTTKNAISFSETDGCASRTL